MLMSSPLAPDAVAGQLIDGVAGQVVAVAVGIAPVAVPAVLTLLVVRWALHKFAVGGGRGGSVGVTSWDGYSPPRQDAGGVSTYGVSRSDPDARSKWKDARREHRTAVGGGWYAG